MHGYRTVNTFTQNAASASTVGRLSLSSPLLLLPIAYYSQLRKEAVPPREERDLLFWLLVANARGRYGRGSAETLLDADLGTLSRGGAPSDLVETVRQQFGRLLLDAEEFVGRGPKSPLSCSSHCGHAARRTGARD